MFLEIYPQQCAYVLCICSSAFRLILQLNNPSNLVKNLFDFCVFRKALSDGFTVLRIAENKSAKICFIHDNANVRMIVWKRWGRITVG